MLEFLSYLTEPAVQSLAFDGEGLHVSSRTAEFKRILLRSAEDKFHHKAFLGSKSSRFEGETHLHLEICVYSVPWHFQAYDIY